MKRGPVHHFKEVIASSYWFIPSILTIGAIILALVLVYLDYKLDPGDSTWPTNISAESARAILTTIATSIMAVTGVVFSITVVVLTLASSQFGPRLVRSFMHDHATQVTLGAFLATFAYCVLVLCSITPRDEHLFTPRLSVLCAVIQVLIDIGILIFFIDHMAMAIQAPTVVSKVSNELRLAIDQLFAEGEEDPAPTGARPDTSWSKDAPGLVTSKSTGYVQNIDIDRLVRLGIDKNAKIDLAARPGQFVSEDQPFAAVHPADRLDEEVEACIHASIILGAHRSMTQDCEFALDQLVEVALRALSPGINDPHTAGICIDHIGAALSLMASRSMPTSTHVDAEGTPRVWLPPVTFDGLVGAAFSEIRQSSTTNVSISVRLIEVLDRIQGAARSDERRETIRRHVEQVAAGIRHSRFTARDSADIAERLERALGDEKDR